MLIPSQALFVKSSPKHPTLRQFTRPFLLFFTCTSHSHSAPPSVAVHPRPARKWLIARWKLSNIDRQFGVKDEHRRLIVLFSTFRSAPGNVRSPLVALFPLRCRRASGKFHLFTCPHTISSSSRLHASDAHPGVWPPSKCITLEMFILLERFDDAADHTTPRLRPSPSIPARLVPPWPPSPDPLHPCSRSSVCPPPILGAPIATHTPLALFFSQSSSAPV